MATPGSGSAAAPPLGWLSNILPGNANRSAEGDDISKSTDVEALIGGVEHDLDVILPPAPALPPATSGDADAPDSTLTKTPQDTPGVSETSSSKEDMPDVSTLSIGGGSMDFGDRDGSSGDDDDVKTQNQDTGGAQAKPIPSPSETAKIDLAARLARTKTLLYDEHNDYCSSRSGGSKRSRHGAPPLASATVYSILKRPRWVPTILDNLSTAAIPFEARKDFSSIVSFLLVSGLQDDGYILGGTTAPSPRSNDESAPHRKYAPVSGDFVRYILETFDDIMTTLVAGHDVEEISSGDGGGNGNVDAEKPALEDGEAVDGPPPPRLRKSTPDVALHCGSMLRSCLRHPKLFKEFLSEKNVPKYVYPFFDTYVHQSNFMVAGDVLETIKFILTGGVNPAIPQPPPPAADAQQQDDAEETTGELASAFLQEFYVPLFEERLNKRLLAPDTPYVIKRASIQLLSSLLLTRSNYPIMMRYIGSKYNLRTIMMLLRDTSPHVTLDAFHVFKIFVANPQRTPEVTKILLDNNVKLVKYLDGLHREREASDLQFRDEKKLVIATLEGLGMEE